MTGLIAKDYIRLIRYMEDMLGHKKTLEICNTVLDKNRVAKALEISLEYLEVLIDRMDKQADDSCKPSMSCLFRPHPYISGKIHWYDVCTAFCIERKINLPRHLLTMSNTNKVDDDHGFAIYVVEVTEGAGEILGLKGRVNVILPPKISPFQPEGKFERELLFASELNHLWD